MSATATTSNQNGRDIPFDNQGNLKVPKNVKFSKESYSKVKNGAIPVNTKKSSGSKIYDANYVKGHQEIDKGGYDYLGGKGQLKKSDYKIERSLKDCITMSNETGYNLQFSGPDPKKMRVLKNRVLDPINPQDQVLDKSVSSLQYNQNRISKEIEQREVSRSFQYGAKSNTWPINQPLYTAPIRILKKSDPKSFDISGSTFSDQQNKYMFGAQDPVNYSINDPKNFSYRQSASSELDPIKQYRGANAGGKDSGSEQKFKNY